MTSLTTTEAAPLAPLTTSEQQELERHEATIRAGLDTFVTVGNALTAIRDNKLYRAEYATFDEYTRGRWGIGRARAYQLMDSAAAVEAVSTIVDIPPPANEAQARPLAGLPPEQQREVWKQASATAPGGKVTGAHVQQVAAKVTGKPAPLTPRPAPPLASAGDDEIAAPAPPRPAPTPIVLTPLAPATAPDRKLLIAKRALLAAALDLIDADLERAGAGPTIVIHQDAATSAARLFLANPAVNGAAGMLAFSAREEAA